MKSVIERWNRRWVMARKSEIEREVETLRLEIAELGVLLGERIKEKNRLDEALNRADT